VRHNLVAARLSAAYEEYDVVSSVERRSVGGNTANGKAGTRSERIRKEREKEISRMIVNRQRRSAWRGESLEFFWRRVKSELGLQEAG